MESYFPEQDVFVAMLTNVKSGEDRTSFSDQRFRLFSQVPRTVLGNLFPKAVAVPDAVLDTYAGKYQTVSGKKTIAIKRKDHTLYMVDGMEFGMHALSERRFYVMDVPAEIFVEFLSDSAGKVTGLVVEQNGRYEWKKIE
jgi:hypothetical protein